MVIVVEIEDCCSGKPFLGGWRNARTGVEYHDARTQTFPGDDVVCARSGSGNEASDDACRFGSTAIAKSRGRFVDATASTAASYRSECTSVSRETAMQTSRFPDPRDKIVTPLKSRPAKRMENFDEAMIFERGSRAEDRRERRINGEDQLRFSRLAEDSAVKIQRCYRAYRGRLDIKALARISRETRAQTPPRPEKIQYLRQCRASKFEILNLHPPRLRSDFQMIQTMLERWRARENSRLDRDFFGTSRLAAKLTLLSREIELLRCIEAMKNRKIDETRRKRYLESLDGLAESEIWPLANGDKTISVDTPRVQRAREFRDFYRSLQVEAASIVRTEFLKKLRIQAARHTCQYAEDLVDLIDQEIELGAMINDEKITSHLRKRLSLALLRLTINSCSPGGKFIGKNSRIARTGKKMSAELCKRCGKFFARDRDLSASLVAPACCIDCRKIQPGEQSNVVQPYETMLEDLRSRESVLGAESNYPAWNVDADTIHRLVNHVWHGKSGISECNDLSRLALVRFRPDEAWSPWNNLLLTKREAALHRTMENPWDIYAPATIKKFFLKNLQAKLRFDRGTG